MKEPTFKKPYELNRVQVFAAEQGTRQIKIIVPRDNKSDHAIGYPDQLADYFGIVLPSAKV